MLFSTLSLALLAASAAAAPAAKRADGGLCYGGVHDIEFDDQYGATVLSEACYAKFPADRTGMWTDRTCVAAAVAATPEVFVDFANCANSSVIVPAESAFPSLDYNVYATIVGDCAWAPNGCPITKQNFIDLVYSELSNIGQNVWPTSADVLVNDRIEPIFTWTAFSDAQGVPYLNFNDYLHYS